jgi:hypothetical protein
MTWTRFSAPTALRRAGRPAGLRSPRGAHGIEGIGLARPAAVLAVGAIYLDDPDPGRGDMAGQARAIAAGPLDPDQAHGPEPAQPAQQPGVTGRRGRELLHAK